MLLKINEFVEDVRFDEYKTAVLLGMGGSSLAPEVFREAFGVRDGYLELYVLDSTDPAAIISLKNKLDLKKTLFLVSTKSGGTVETVSFMKYFYNQVKQLVPGNHTGDHFVAITDSGSELDKTAKRLRFRRTFLNDPNIGGRNSALSFFGLVPAALIGVDLVLLLERALTMACNAEGYNCPVSGDNTSAELGAIMGELAKVGRDKLTIVCSPSISAFGAWLEQLIAESTGKDGKGILPVEGEALLEPSYYADDRLFAYLRLHEEDEFDGAVQSLQDAGYPVVRYDLRDIYDIGGELFRWEMATAVTGTILGINPFNQPDVEAAKVLAREMVAEYKKQGHLPERTPVYSDGVVSVFQDRPAASLRDAIDSILHHADTPGKNGFSRAYVALQAYVQPTAEMTEELSKIRTHIQQKYKVATTFGYGPRFLHSTGQLHKGDGGNGLFIQITKYMPKDVSIPENAGTDYSSISFGVLKNAQALGDARALSEKNRRVVRFHLEAKGGLESLQKALP